MEEACFRDKGIPGCIGKASNSASKSDPRKVGLQVGGSIPPGSDKLVVNFTRGP